MIRDREASSYSWFSGFWHMDPEKNHTCWCWWDNRKNVWTVSVPSLFKNTDEMVFNKNRFISPWKKVECVFFIIMKHVMLLRQQVNFANLHIFKREVYLILIKQTLKHLRRDHTSEGFIRNSDKANGLTSCMPVSVSRTSIGIKGSLSLQSAYPASSCWSKMKVTAVLLLCGTLFCRANSSKTISHSVNTFTKLHVKVQRHSFVVKLSLWSDRLDSCQGRCGASLDNTYSCQCNAHCENFNDCCSDYYMLCKGEGHSQTNSRFKMSIWWLNVHIIINYFIIKSLL